MRCPAFTSRATTERSDRTELGYRRFRCRNYGRGFSERSGTVFNRLQYPCSASSSSGVCATSSAYVIWSRCSRFMASSSRMNLNPGSVRGRGGNCRGSGTPEPEVTSLAPAWRGGGHRICRLRWSCEASPATEEDPMTEERMALIEAIQKTAISCVRWPRRCCRSSCTLTSRH